MDQVCMSGVGDKPAVAGNEPTIKIGGDAPATTGSDCFDCNICLEFAVEPVVTLCGHLYCWPCIYEWLRPDPEVHTNSGRSSSRRQCPVCKAVLSPDMLVPLDGRGGSSKKPQHGLAIPHRPALHRKAVEQQSTQNSDNSDRHHRDTEPDMPTRPLRHVHHHDNATQFDVLYPPLVGRGMVHSTAGGVLGGMAVAVLPWVFRGQVPPSMYYASPYYLSAHNLNPRLRRQQIEVERSLHQIWFFLCVFVVLCLLLF